MLRTNRYKKVDLIWLLMEANMKILILIGRWFKTTCKAFTQQSKKLYKTRRQLITKQRFWAKLGRPLNLKQKLSEQI